jgi:hypothetical protein
MLYPQVPIKTWCNRYKIIRDRVVCGNCGDNSVEFTTPIAIKGYRGVETGVCSSCNVNPSQTRWVPVGEKELRTWERLRP